MSRGVTLILAMAMTLLLAGAVAAEPVSLQQMNHVEKIAVSAGESCSLDLSIQDRAGFGDAVVGIKGREVSLLLPRTYTHPPVLSLAKPGKSCFEKAVVAQIDSQTVRAVAILKESYKGETTPSFTVGKNIVYLTVGAKPSVAAAPLAPSTAAPTETPAEPAGDNVPPEAKIDWASILAAPAATPEAAVAENTPAATPAIAVTQSTPAPAASLADVGWSSAAWKMTMALGAGLAAILILAGLAKRFKLPSRLTGSRASLIRVVQTGILDMKHRVAVVDVAGELLVVALANNQVTMLAKIESEEARRRLLGDAEAPSRSQPEFNEPAFLEAGLENVKTMGTATNDFSAKLRAYTRHAPKESAVAGHDTLNSIVEKVKKLKRL